MTDDEPIVDDRERRLIEAVVTLAKSFRDDTDRLERRLAALELRIEALAIRLAAQGAPSFPPRTGAPDDPPSAPSRTPW